MQSYALLAGLSEATSTPGISDLERGIALIQFVNASRPMPTTGQFRDSATSPCVRREHARLASAGIEHLSTIVARLNELWKGPEEDDYGRLRPTDSAYETAIGLLVDCAIDGAPDERMIPAACVSTDSEGGVRVEWVRDQASVHLVVSAERSPKSAYIYYEGPEGYATEPATAEALLMRLRSVSP